jgi:1-acyl-sn-glycerol-3-phosphate acyltransferase
LGVCPHYLYFRTNSFLMRLFFMKAFSLLIWIAMVVTSILITPFFLLVWVTTFWWDKRRVAAHFMGTFWAWNYQSLVPFWKLSLEGREKIPWNRPVVLISNHKSQVDILALYKLRRPFKWTSKAENFKMPFVGMVLSLTNSIKVHRESLRSGAQFMSKAEAEMKKGSSILLFPEGTRSKKETMRPFKEGAFLLAKRTSSPIIPIILTGSEKTFPGSGFLMAKANIRIKVLDEIPASTVDEMDVKTLMALVRQNMEEGLVQLELERS